MLALDTVVLTDNQATGSDGVNGGDGLGGGLYNLGTATVVNSLIKRNKAKGGSAGSGGLAGKALGGGVYNAGSISIDALTVIYGNSPDNRYGC